MRNDKDLEDLKDEDVKSRTACADADVEKGKKEKDVENDDGTVHGESNNENEVENDLEKATSSDENDEKKIEKKETIQNQTNLLPRKALIIVFSGLALSITVPMLDQTQVATIIPIIAKDFQAGKESTWIATASLLTSTSFQPMVGRFSDIFGRKRLMIICMVNFFVWSLACGLAQSIIQLIVFRALAGIGSGGILSLVMIIVSDVVSLRDRGKYQGLISVTIALANGLGPTIGGSLAEKASWRWAFFLNVPLSIIAIVVIVFCLPLKHVKGDLKQKLLKVDYGGSILVTGSSVLLLLSLNWGGVTYPWSSGTVIGILISSFVLFGAFLMWEWRGAKLPIVPLGIFRNITVSAVYVTSAANGVVVYMSLFFVPQLYQVVRGYSPIQSGLLLLPLTGIQSIASFAAGLIVSRTGRYKVNIVVGWAIWSVGMGLVSTLDEHSSAGQAAGYLLLTGLGAGQTFQTSLIAAQASVPRNQMAVVTAIRNFIRQLGGTIGLAIASTTLNNSLRSHLTSLQISPETISSILDDPVSIQSLPPSDLRTSAIQGYRQGFRIIFLIGVAFTGISFFASLFFIAEVPLIRDDDKKLKAEGKKWLEQKKAKAQAKLKTPTKS